MIKITSETADAIIKDELAKATIKLYDGLEGYPYRYMVGTARGSNLVFMRQYGHDERHWFRSQQEHIDHQVRKFIDHVHINDIDYLYTHIARNAVTFTVISDIYGIMENETMEEEETIYWTTEAMIRRGGGFVHKLGELIRKGDLTNQRILINAFPGYWKKYTEIGINNRERWKAE